jgi:hypothetical protein
MPTHFTARVDEEFKFGVNARIRDKTADQASFSVGTVPNLP